MSYTALQIVTQAQTHAPDLSQTQALDWLNQEHSEICRRVKIYPDDAVDVTLVAGQAEYAVSGDLLRIWEATYLTSATGARSLRASSVDELDYEHRSAWRQTPASQPYLWYESGGHVGLYPPPSLATSGGYPKVTLYAQTRRTLALADALPAQIDSPDAWVYGIVRRWAAAQHQDALPLFLRLSHDATQALARHIHGRAARGKQRARACVPRIRH